MILILSDKNDIHADHVEKKIASQGLPYCRLNLDVDSLKKTIVSFENGVWTINQNSVVLNLLSIKCVWNRRTFVELLLNEQYDQSTDFKIWKNEWNKTLLGIYSTLRTLPWLNPWRKAYEAENKYLQMELAQNNGLRIPETIISNNKKTLISFAQEHDSVALKLMHQDFYKDKEEEYKGFYVNKISISDLKTKFKDVDENPVVLQKYVEKEYEVRYTIVGKEHYICKIDSQKSTIANTDWRRYDIPNTPHSIVEPPQQIRDGVSNLMLDLGIEYGALDFIVDKAGDWIFLEVNSMGQFLWIEDLTGLNISNGIVHWLKNKLN